MPYDAVVRGIEGLLPDGLVVGWWWIARGRLVGSEEAGELAACWILEHGRALGFRPPSAAERLRALGLHRYLETETGLSERDLLDAAGTASDPAATGTRLQPGLAAWTAGAVGPEEAPNPGTLERLFAIGRSAALASGAPPEQMTLVPWSPAVGAALATLSGSSRQAGPSTARQPAVVAPNPAAQEAASAR